MTSEDPASGTGDITDAPATSGTTGTGQDSEEQIPSALARARRVAGLPKPRPEPDPAAKAESQSAGGSGQAAAGEPTGAPAVQPRRTAGRPAQSGDPRPGQLQPGVTWVLETPKQTDPTSREELAAAPGAAGQNSKAGRNLPAAIGVGVGLGALIAASLFLYRPSFAYIVGVAVVYGCYELTQALKAATIRITLVPLVVGGVATLVAAWQRGPSGLVVAALVTLLAVFLWRVADGANGYTRDTAASALVLVYLPTLAGFAVLLAHPDDGAARVVAFVATVVCSDTGGYAAGVLFGRHPLAPVVSKAKTWEGFAGSVLACSAAGILFLTLTFHEAWWKGLLFGVAVAVTATLGDLGESMIKRDLRIKDMGRLLPGHGGLMDRLDSLLPCAAVAYLLLSAFAPL